MEKNLAIKRMLYRAIIVCVGMIVILLGILILGPEQASYAEEHNTDDLIGQPVVKTAVYTITDEERTMLAKLVHCEASVMSQEGRIAVASVIFNRLDAGKWGDTLYDVVHYPNAFTPVLYGLLENTVPDQRDYDAVDYVVENGPTVPTYVRYFRTDYDFKWENYQNYCVIDTMYFGYFSGWMNGEW